MTIGEKIKELFRFFVSIIKKIKDIADEDSLRGYIVSIILVVILLKFIILPIIGFSLGGTSYPIVSVVSNSMEHKITTNTICGNNVAGTIDNFDDYWYNCGNFYERINISKEQFNSYPMPNGFNVGDALVIYKEKAENIKVGDILLYIRFDGKPIIHRIIMIKQNNSDYTFITKGDYNSMPDPRYEYSIKYDQIEGIAKLRLPYFGLPKYYFSKLFGLI